jgi:restriction system protein
MPRGWMVRAEGGEIVEDFARGWVALGWHEIGDLSTIETPDSMRVLYERTYPDHRPGKVAGAVAMFVKFRRVISVGDRVVSYDPSAREYLVGTITSDYLYDPRQIQGYPHLRKVSWDGRVSRDKLPVASRKSLGSTLTVFSLNDDVWTSIADQLRTGDAPAERPESDDEAELEESREVTETAAHELIKDQVIQLDDREMEELTAALLRAMGYRTRLSPRGADRGVDVFASPDGLGLQEPRIKVEVKHRPRTQMGSQELRGFIGGLREGDRGLFVSSGGFTKEARYEAERSKIPVTLLDLGDLVTSITTHYENFDALGRALLPLARLYWPIRG